VTRVALTALVVLAACTGPEPGIEPMATGDVDSFAASVQPIVTDTCASLDCHGAPGRPLRLYAERGLRLTRELRDQPITAEEVEHNAAAFLGVSPGITPDEHLAVLKPLAVEAGGMEHLGGDLWDSMDDPNCAAVREWLQP
jgi:hypothetical protein